MPQYQYATAQNATDALDARLYDLTNGAGYNFWTFSELLGYIREALRTFNALSGFWRSEMTFQLVINQWWYDLAVQSGTVIPYTVTQNEIIQVIENHLLEPPTATYPLTWTGSSQFAISDILSALQSIQDDLLGTTACVLSQSFVNAALVPRTVLPDTTLDVRRVAWIPSSGFLARPLNQSDFYAARAFNPGYTAGPAKPPSTWMQNTEPPPSFDVNNVPPVTGQYDMLTANSGPAWSAASGSLMNIPDDWTWVAKWGALSELLARESPAKDQLRAEYCRKRYQEGLGLLENAPLVLAMRLNNVPIATDSVYMGDRFNPNWQSAAAGKPRSAYNARNMVAFGPMPDMAYAATASVCQNAPVPSAPGDYIQISRDCYDSVLDIAQHLSAFKMGGTEFTNTISLYQKAQKKAAEYGGKLKEMGFFEWPQQDISQLQEQQAGRYLPGTGPADSTT